MARHSRDRICRRPDQLSRRESRRPELSLHSIAFVRASKPPGTEPSEPLRPGRWVAPRHIWRTRRQDATRGGLRPMAKVMVVDDAYSELQVMETILRSAGHDGGAYLGGDGLEGEMVRKKPHGVLLERGIATT